MALSKSVIPLTFSQGVDTKSDPKALGPLLLTEARNCVFRKANRISKRAGRSAKSKRILGSSAALENPQALATFQDELLTFDKQGLYSYSPSADAWVAKGPAISLKVKTDAVIKNNYEQSQVDQAVNGNIGLVAYEDTRGGVRYCVYDADTGTILVSDAIANASASRPRCVAFGDSLYLLYVVGNDLRGLYFGIGAPSSVSSEVTISSGSVNSTNCHLDAIPMDTFIAAAYNVQGSAQVRVHSLNSVLTSTSSVNIAEAGTNCVSLMRTASSQICTLWHNASGVRAAIHNVFLAQVVAPLTVDNEAGTVDRITAYRLPADTGIRLFYEYQAALTYNRYVKTNTVTNGGSAGAASVFLRGVGIASKAWAYSPDTTDRGFLTLVHDSALQSTYFIARNDGMVVAKLQYGYAGGLLSRSMPSTVQEVSPGVFSFAMLTKNPVVSLGDTTFLTFRGVSRAKVDFTVLPNFWSSQLDETTQLLVGGCLLSYDGHSVVEHGFHLFPENVSLAASVGGSLTTLGAYSYCACYEWSDSVGQIHRSAPSVPVAVTLTGANNRVTLTIPTLRLTEKRGNRTNVNIVVYRTEANGTTYYRTSSPTAFTYNDTAADTVSLVDDLADSTLIGRQLLYTTGGVLENIAPPAAGLIEVFGNRVWVAGTEDDRIWYSKEKAEAQPVEFNDSLTLALDPVGGQVTAIVAMDDKMVFFKESRIYYTSGDGPNDLGGGNVFMKPQQVSLDIGAISANSAALTPRGIVFSSRKGIYLLSKALELIYIGAAVEAYNGLTISSATALGDLQEVRFTTLESQALVWNYEFQQWSTLDNYQANDSIAWGSRYACISRQSGSSAIIVTEDDSFTDDGKYYPMAITSGWLSFAGLQALQRVYRLIILGEHKSAHKFRVQVSYDFVDVVVEDHILDTASALNIVDYGDGVYGDSSPYGGELIPFQFRIHIGRQKCQAIKFSISDLSQTGSGESYNITGIAFQVGNKSTIGKLRTSQSA